MSQDKLGFRKYFSSSVQFRIESYLFFPRKPPKTIKAMTM